MAISAAGGGEGRGQEIGGDKAIPLTPYDPLPKSF